MSADQIIIARHLEHMRQRGLSPYTIYQRGGHLARLAAAIAPVPLLDATPGMLARWRAGLRVGEDGIRNYVGAARRFYDWALDEGLAGDNPAARLPVPRPSRRLPRPMAEDALFAAVAAAPGRIRPWLVLAAWEGLRAKEIALLRRENVLDGAREPALFIARGATKGRRERLIPLSAFVLEELLDYGLPRSGWVFRRSDGRAGPNTPQLVSKLSGEHLRACGISGTLHMCRHRFATEAYRHGHDLRVVQELLGHASPQSTAGYAQYDRADAAAAVASLPAPGRLRAVAS
jgi:integrase/recombinase XerC